MLVVETPEDSIPEREYALGVVLGNHLGLEWVRRDGAPGVVTIGSAETPGIRITLSDAFFSGKDTMPQSPLKYWDPCVPGLLAVPVLFGDAVTDTMDFSIDVFGSAFFMLTRYEEWANDAPHDVHDRYPATASIAYANGFLDRPIIDEYTEILWARLSATWPGLTRKRLDSTIQVSCDVDDPYCAYTASASKAARKVAGDLLKRFSPAAALRTVRNYASTSRGVYVHDPQNRFDWMMDANERAGHRMTFYFLCGRTVPAFDAHYSIDEPRIRALMRQIANRGHRIGIHGSYGTYRNPVALAVEAARLQRVLEEEDIERGPILARQHYLRWRTPVTARAMDAAGIAQDSTLGYADRPGFRCGTSRPFPMFDLDQRRELAVVERPLIAMECSILDEEYLGLGHTEEAEQTFRSLRERSTALGGEFNLLWHNSHLSTASDREMYLSVIGHNIG